MEKITIALEAIGSEFCWDNWEVDEVDGVRNSSANGGYWKVSEVLHCKVEWLRELLSELSTLPKYESGELDEHSDTIDQLQKLLAAVSAYEIG
jgi:hypothetical protein